MIQRISCISIRSVLQSAISLSSGIPPVKSSENSQSPEIPVVKPPVTIPDPYDLAYEAEMLFRCHISPLDLSLQKYKQEQMESENATIAPKL